MTEDSTISKPRLAVIDYGMGNLRSVVRAWEHIGANAFLVSGPSEIANADALIFPGQGSIVDTMRLLESTGFDNMIRDWIAADRPFFGICLGLQALFEHSEEGDTVALGIFKGSVKRFRFNFRDPSHKIPHMGWNELKIENNSKVFRDINKNNHAYFIHSYEFIPKDKKVISLTTNYGKDVMAAVSLENIFGSQFHPEKSQTTGIKILKNFLKL